MLAAITEVVLVIDGPPRRRRRLQKSMDPLGCKVLSLESIDRIESDSLQTSATAVLLPMSQSAGGDEVHRLKCLLPQVEVVLLAAHNEVDEATLVAEKQACMVSELPVLNAAWLRSLVAGGLRASRRFLELEQAQVRDIDRALASLGALGYRKAKAALLARFDSVYAHALLEHLGKAEALKRSALSSSGFRELCRRAETARAQFSQDVETS